MSSDDSALQLPAQTIPVPKSISAQGQAYLAAAAKRLSAERAAGLIKTGTLDQRAQAAAAVQFLRPLASRFQGSVNTLVLPSGAKLYRVTPLLDLTSNIENYTILSYSKSDTNGSFQKLCRAAARLQSGGSEYRRTGFQGGLNSYRILTNPTYSVELTAFSGRTIDVPSCFIGGARDWGVRQSPGAFESMGQEACTRLLGVHLIEGAGHSVPEEQPEQMNRLLIEFLKQLPA